MSESHNILPLSHISMFHLGLTENALYHTRRMHENFPKPKLIKGRTKLYDVPEVIAFHRHVVEMHKRGLPVYATKARKYWKAG